MIFDKIIENVMNNYYSNHPQGADLIKIDLREIFDEQSEDCETYEEEILRLQDEIYELEQEIEGLESALYD
jgi:chaperonin cofactor prefoldin